MPPGIREILEGEPLSGTRLPRGGVRRLGTGGAPGRLEGLMQTPQGAHGVSRAGAVVFSWEPSTREVRRIVRATGEVLALAASPQGRHLALAIAGAPGEPALVVVVEAGGGRVQELAEIPGEVSTMALSQDGRVLAARGEDGTVTLARVGEPGWTRSLRLRSPGGAPALAPSADGDLLFVLGGGELVVLELEQGMVLERRPTPPELRSLVALTPGWPEPGDPALGPELWCHAWEHPFEQTTLCLLASTREFLMVDRSGGRLRTATESEFEEGGERCPVAPASPESRVEHLCFEPGAGGVLLSTGTQVVRRDAEGEDHGVLARAAPGETLRGLGLAPGRGHLLMARAGRLEALALGAAVVPPVRALAGLGRRVSLAAAVPRLVFPGGEIGSDAPGGTLALRDLEDPGGDRNLGLGDYLPAGPCALSGDARRVATGAFRPRVHGHALLVFDLPSGRRRLVLPLGPERVHALGFSPDGTLLALGAGERPASLVAIEPLAEERDLGLAATRLTALAWHPDSRLLALAGDDRSLCLWDRRVGTVTARLELPRAPARVLCFSDQGERLAAGGEDGSLWIWRTLDLFR